MSDQHRIDAGSAPMGSPLTFMGVPAARSARGAGAAVLGIPFDCGTHPVRIGARYGPQSIREQSALVRPYQPPHADFSPLALLDVVDLGNVDVTPSVIEPSFERIEAAVRHVLDAGAIPVTMGGDGAVTLPQLRAVHARHADLVVLHVDAHTDTYRGDGNAPHHRYNTATTFTRAAEEELVDAARSIHVGARGTLAVQGVFEHTRAQGYEILDGATLNQRGLAHVAASLRERFAGRPVYLCFDMDFFDPSCAPGVCTPTWGGASAREGLDFLHALAGIDFVAFDVNTVSPPHDVAGMTAFLAGTVMLECLTLACLRPGGPGVG